MIIVKNPPQVVTGTLVSPVVFVKVLGRNGLTLRYYTVDLGTKEVIDQKYTKTITGDPYETTVVFPTPNTDANLLYVIEVLDANGSVLETWTTHALFLPSGDNIALDDFYDVVVISKLGTIYDLGRSKVLPRHYSLISIARKQGKLLLYEGFTKKAEVEGKQALLELKLRIRDDIAYVLANYIEDKEVGEIVYKEPSLAPRLGILAYITQALKSSRMSVVGTKIERGSYWYDVSTYLLVDLYSNWDWRTVINVLLGIGAIIGGVLALAGSYGVSTPLSMALIGAGISILSGFAIAIYNAGLREEPSNVIPQAEATADASIRLIEEYKSNLIDYLNSLLAQGRITQDEYNKILEYVNKIVDTSKSAITELKTMVKKAYNEGYKKGVEESKTWIITGTLGGLLGGYLLAQRPVREYVIEKGKELYERVK